MIDDSILVADERPSQFFPGVQVSFHCGEGVFEMGVGRDAVALVLNVALLVLADEAVA